MSIDFAKLTGITTDRGAVTKIEADGKVIWNGARYRYVSLGDSIAAGHTINADWEKDYGEGSQYGNNGNTSTVIVPNSYTDLIRKELENVHGKSGVTAVSFAHSGDTVADLMEKLTHDGVRRTISKADLVTICIGANDVLQPAMSNLGPYISTGNIDDLARNVEANLAALPASYESLFDALTGLNQNAKFVFTTVYNPYKYLWLEKSTSGGDYLDGFLGPLMWVVPNDLPLGLSSQIRKAFIETPKVRDTIDRVNAIGGLAEGFITRLNAILSTKIAQYGNPNIILADTKAVFDPVPDRPVSAPRHYNDLVNVELTRGYVIEDLDWGKFWGNVNWSDVISNINNVANDVMNNVINNVILPDVDPHPEVYGQYALKCSFADALGWSVIPRRTITYGANGGTGSMASQTIVALDGNAAYTNIQPNSFGIPNTGDYFTGWKDQNGVSYSAGQLVGLTGNLSLSAQWSNLYTLTYTHSQGDVIQVDSGQTGPMECYALWIEGTEQSDLGAFSNPARSIRLPYGTNVDVIAAVSSGDDRSYITLNGTPVSGKSSRVTYDFVLTGDTTVNFEWNQWLSNYIYMQSYWNCYITTH